MRTFYSLADHIMIDGMPLILIGRLLGKPFVRENRLTWLDEFPPLLARAADEGWRVFYLGSKPGITERGAEILRRAYPGLQIATAHGYFDAAPDSPENTQRVELINSYKPQVLMVGMGMPRQEHWILDNVARLRTGAIIPCGALMDYLAGAIPTPPRWTGAVGLEWLFRLISEPRRLARRYLMEPWFVAWLVLREVVRRFRKGGRG